jgi:gamma-glutamylcyclotransferase (GGCT)/AIG2-like uncharacterized protein YtfP
VAENTVLMFLNGTAMSGQKDHAALGGSRFLGEIATAPAYRFYAVRDEFPGLVPVESGGASILGELYEMKLEIWRDALLPAEPHELVPGTVILMDGRIVRVMTLELERVKPGDKLVDISELGSWRRYQTQILG